MKHVRIGISLAALIAMTAQASAAALCDATAAAALKTAAVQQELMVAGLMCGDVSAYNRFVLDYQSQLQKSDAQLMAYFRGRDGNEAGYDSYKTKLANLAAGKSSAESARYCAGARRDFAAATAQGQTLDNFIATDRLLIAAPEACAIRYDADVEVAGVPGHDLPAAPFGPVTPAPTERYSAPPPRATDPDRREAYNDLPRPPRYAPRRWEEDWDESDGYGAPSYGPPSYGPPAYGSSAYDPPRAWRPRLRRRAWYSAYNDQE